MAIYAGRQSLVTDIVRFVTHKHEMGGAFSTYGGKREVHTGFWWGGLREGGHLGDPGVDGRIIL
jgi:hypothetical protein